MSAPRRLPSRLMLGASCVLLLIVFALVSATMGASVAVVAGGLVGGWAAQGERFATVDLYIDSGEAPLAAWQVELHDTRGAIKIVGIEGGEHGAFLQPPYYDARALMRDRVIVASFSTAPAEALPHGKTRIATLHVQITGDVQPQYVLELITAATVDGSVIDAHLSFAQGTAP